MIKHMGMNVKIHESARIDVTYKLVIDDNSIVNRDARIEGRYVVIGRNAWIGERAHIGGGSCFDRKSELIAGDFLHMGKDSHINTARSVKIGDEVGIGEGTKIFTHSAYLSAWEGFPYNFAPVTIGNRVWLPHAWVNPGVTIGDDVVVAAMSLVNKDIPRGAFVAGVPAEVVDIRFPRKLNDLEKNTIINKIMDDLRIRKYSYNRGILEVDKIVFNVDEKTISGYYDLNFIEPIINQFRRYGIRFAR